MKNKGFILGTVQFGLSYGINNASGKPSEAHVFEILDYAYDKGIRILDSADAYGDAQQLIGRFTRQTGKQFLVNTKFKMESGGSISRMLAHTLEQLRYGQVNVYFFHRFEEMIRHPEAMQQLKQLKQQQLIRKTGVSVYTNEELEQVLENEGVDVVQLPFNLLDNFSKRGALLQKAKRLGKEVQVRSVFLQGLFFKAQDQYPDVLRPLQPYVQQLHRLAAENDISVYDLALGYVLNIPEIDQVIIGVDNKQQLMDNIRVQNKPLPKALLQRVNAIMVPEEALLNPSNWK